MKANFLPALTLTLFCILLFAGAYTAVIWIIARVAGPRHGEGAVLIYKNRIVGFEEVGQAFTADKYFTSRPSAVNYNAAGSGGSNKGPSNPDYLLLVSARIDTFLVHNPGIRRSEIPAELVTASGSGLDPHISWSAAKIQVARIAKARHISVDSVDKILSEHVEKPWLHLFGPSQLNVLRLNISLDDLK